VSEPRLPISVVVLTHNEELNIRDCLAGVASWAAETIVVDSGSTDTTRLLAEQYGATVYHHPFTDHRSQWSWALHEVPLRSEWVLGLDADQRVTPELTQELRTLFTHEHSRLAATNGFFIKRRQIFRGRWIRHGGYYPKYLLKLFRRNSVYFDEHDLLDHHFYVEGRVAKLEHDLIEDNRNEWNIEFWIAKHNSYAVRHAREELMRRTGAAEWALRPNFFGSPDQRVMWLKQRWYHLPLFVRPALYFAYRYILRRGFLDGKEGFIFHFLQGFWYRLLVDIHLDDLLQQQQFKSPAVTADESALHR
jgi:glycosyltransferase involved in cell wall biosynthesis